MNVCDKCLAREPDAGNPHVRFDEGEGGHPQGWPPLYSTVASFVDLGVRVSVRVSEEAESVLVHLTRTRKSLELRMKFEAGGRRQGIGRSAKSAEPDVLWTACLCVYARRQAAAFPFVTYFGRRLRRRLRITIRLRPLGYGVRRPCVGGQENSVLRNTLIKTE